MQELIKRYFWVVGALVVITCASFDAMASGYIIEARFLGDARHRPKVAPIAPAQQKATVTRSKDGEQLAERNMFCSDCGPDSAVPPPVPSPNPTDPNNVHITSLPLVLLATNVSDTQAQSFATILNNESQRQGSYAIEELIPGAGTVKEIHFKYVDFEKDGHKERVMLLGAPPSVAPPAVTSPVSEVVATNTEDDPMAKAVQDGIKKIDDTNYEIKKELVDQVLMNPMAVAKGARIVPAIKGGKPDGFKLYAIRPSSVYAQLGMSNGDTLHGINGFELTSADKALEVYTKLREATSLDVDVTRRGKPVTLHYTIK